MIIWHQLTLSLICSTIWQAGRRENRNVHKSSKCTPIEWGKSGWRKNTFSVKRKTNLQTKVNTGNLEGIVLYSEERQWMMFCTHLTMEAGAALVPFLAAVFVLPVLPDRIMRCGSCTVRSYWPIRLYWQQNWDGNSVSRASPARQEAFLVSLLYSAIVSIICSALGSLPSLMCRPQRRLF